MKKLYFLLACLSAGQISLAQTSTRLSSLQREKMTPGSSQSANKTTVTLSRLKATAKSYRSNGQLVTYDSFRVSYTGDRSYDEQTQRWKYDTMLGWKFDKGNPVESYKATQTFDGANRITAANLENKNNGLWATEQLERFTHDASGMLDTSVFSKLINVVNWDSTKTINFYNGAGKSLGNIVQKKLNTWQNTSRNRHILNTSNDVDSIFFEEWNANSNTWEPHMMYKYSYLNNKFASVTLHYLIGNGTWKKGSETEVTYHSNGKYSTEIYKTWSDTLSAWVIDGRKTHTYNSSNDLTSSVKEGRSGNNWVNEIKVEYSYNSFGQITIETEYAWKSGQWEAGTQKRNYYELYFPASVKNTAVQSQLKLYPVPAKNRVNVQLDLDKPASVNISIHDMSGKMVKSLSLTMVSQHSGYIDLASLPSGNYTVKMAGAGSTQVQTLTIVK